MRCFAAEENFQTVASNADFGDRILRHDAAIVLHFHVQVGVWKNAFAERQYFRELIRAQPVVEIVPNVGLKDDRFFAAGQSTAVDKISDDVTHLSHMSVSGNLITIR